jgi:hypothetical protein
MKSSEYGSFVKTHNFNLNNVVCVIEDGFECKTYLNNGIELRLSWSDMRHVLDRFPEVFSYEIFQRIRINPEAVSGYLEEGMHVDVILSNGIVLKDISMSDFEKRILPKLAQEKEQ